MPVFPASVNLVVNREVLGVMALSLGAFPVLDALWRVLKSGTACELGELRGLGLDRGLAVRAAFCGLGLAHGWPFASSQSS